MTKKEFISKLTEERDGYYIQSNAEATRIVELVIETISESLTAGNDVDLSGLGKFSAVLQKGRSGTVPGTDKAYSTQDKMVPKFRSSAQLKRSVAGEE